MASTRDPADITTCGGRESTQMTVATTSSPPKPPESVTQPNSEAPTPNRSEVTIYQKASGLPAASSDAAITNRKPSLKSGCRFESDTEAIITLAY